LVNDADLRKHIIEYNMQRPQGCDITICHAPLRSIYFGFGGIVTTCCFNRNYVLGKYPENSLDEIIHGEKRKLLQQHLDRIDFSIGCKYCKDMIAAHNFMSVNARFSDNFPEQSDFPSKMEFELDNTCNLKCEMCNAKFSSAHDNGRRTVAPYDNEDFIKQLKPFIPYLIETKFLGGEPFMSDLYPKIWESIIELNPKCKIRMQSNGTILNDKIKSILQRGNFQIGLSIDTLNPERYAKIRNGAKLEKTLENLEFFNHICKKNGDYINISVCPMKENRFDIPELVKFCNDKNIFIYFNSVSTENFTISELSVQEIDELIDYYKRNNPKGYNYISIHNHIAFSNLIKSIEYIKEQCEQSKIQYEYMNEMIPCTRKEYKEIVLSIISSTPDIKYDETIWDYIPEKFSIRRNDYLYMKNNKPIWDLKEFFSQSTENQIKYIKEFFQEY
jgi:MoaA/NifB/PqqE/SkfB family radical SAM enzyme